MEFSTITNKKPEDIQFSSHLKTHTALKWLIPMNMTIDLHTWDFRIVLSLYEVRDVWTSG